jgi:hypothetical protein
MESEKNTEKYLRNHITELGGVFIKMRPIENGYPDRLCILPGPRYFFVEVKSESKEPEPLQLIVHDELRELGCHVYVVHTKSEVDHVLQKFMF